MYTQTPVFVLFHTIKCFMDHSILTIFKFQIFIFFKLYVCTPFEIKFFGNFYITLATDL